MVVNFGNHHRTDPRSRIGAGQGAGDLRRELFLTHIVDETPEGHAVGRGAKAESVRVAGKVRVRVSGEQVNLLAMRTEGKAVADAGCRVELCFVERDETKGGNERAILNSKLPGDFWIICQEPTADVRPGGRRVEQFDCINL